MVRIEYTGAYRTGVKKLLDEDPLFHPIVEARIQIFRVNSKDTRLTNHALRKRLPGKWAFSITDDIRIIYRWKGKKTAQFLVIGRHKVVYRSN